MNYLGVTPYFQISQSYLEMGDTLKAESLLTSLLVNSGNKNITLQLIDSTLKQVRTRRRLKSCNSQS
jgi:hypothetical protein